MQHITRSSHQDNIVFRRRSVFEQMPPEAIATASNSEWQSGVSPGNGVAQDRGRPDNFGQCWPNLEQTWPNSGNIRRFCRTVDGSSWVPTIDSVGDDTTWRHPADPAVLDVHVMFSSGFWPDSGSDRGSHP